ncbi:MAG: hypothetical protein LH469_01035, partial [Frankiaceae bacterium]|nr:hypothetical protein [Frankiaceae bacterium]
MNGNVTALSDGSGDMSAHGAHGVYVDDRRVVHRLQVALRGGSISPVAHSSSGNRSDFFGSARHLGDAGPDPTVEVRRQRTAIDMGIEEHIEVTSRASGPVETELVVRLAGDGADVGAVKSGAAPTAVLPVVTVTGGLAWRDDRHEVQVGHDGSDVQVGCDEAGSGLLRMPVRVGPGQTWSVTLTITATRVRSSLLDADPGSQGVDWSDVRVRAQDSALEPTVRASLDDLQHLLLRDPQDARDVFAAAGTPWYLTLF